MDNSHLQDLIAHSREREEVISNSQAQDEEEERFVERKERGASECLLEWYSIIERLGEN